MPSTAPRTPLSPVTQEFGRRVRERRHALGLSQEALAERSRLHWSYIGRVERGQVNLSLHNIVSLAETLEMDPGELTARLTLH